MKTTIISFATLLAVVSGITKSAYAAPVNNKAVTVLNDISAINKIEVHGNVELYISDANADQVKVYNKYYAESALVQSKNGVLRITSYNAEKLVVWVSAKDLRSVSAYDNAVVKSFGNLSKVEFDVDLHNSATAKLDLNAYNANVTVTDQAKAELSGSADEFNLNRNNASNVNKTKFTSVHYNENKLNVTAAVVDKDGFAGL